MKIKIIDFGFAIQTSDANQKLRTFCGTPAFMSPELCNNQEYSGPASDNWAAGIVLYTILFGIEPFRGKTERELFKRINSGKLIFPESTHQDFSSSCEKLQQQPSHKLNGNRK